MAGTWGIVKNLWDTFGNNPDNQRTVDSMKGMLGLLPAGAGDVASGLLAADDLRRGDYTSAALNGVGVLPFIPSMAGMVKGKGDDIAKAIRQPTKYEQAHEVARQNAVKMLGLPENNTAMDRAKALGYTIPAYHGTASDFGALDTGMLGTATGAQSAKDAFWSAQNPSTAAGYADYAANSAPVRNLVQKADEYERLAQRTGKQEYWDKYDDVLRQAEELEQAISDNRLNGQNVMPLLIKGTKQNSIDAGNNSFYDLEGGVNDLLKKTKRQRKDVAIIKNLDDDAGFSNRPTDHYGVVNPTAVRSRFAAFDPARINEPDLLGRVNPELLPWLTGAGLLGAGGMYYSGQ